MNLLKILGFIPKTVGRFVGLYIYGSAYSQGAYDRLSAESKAEVDAACASSARGDSF